MLKSFPSGSTAVVFGAGGGIGRAFAELLAADPAFSAVVACSRRPLDMSSAKIRSEIVDILDENSIASVAATLKPLAPPLVLIATGILHEGASLQPEKTWRHLTLENMQQVFAVNTMAPALIIKHLLPILPREGKSVLAALSARVGSISDNGIGGWYSYRASKAALNMMLRTASIEHSRRWKEGAVIGLHPGTVDTDLSEPFQGAVPGKQLFTAKHSATEMLAVVDRIGPADTGQVFDYSGKVVAF
ncbi:MAG: SDR family NAD(P)-dependent oxidoreductase [Pseudomonadota bacterium]